MGVGAIFISTLALTRLPEPQSPPADQSELLAATLQPIVSFVVLCSILIRKSLHLVYSLMKFVERMTLNRRLINSSLLVWSKSPYEDHISDPYSDNPFGQGTPTRMAAIYTSDD